jgi:predicted nucleic acid-binding Zn ribbon protein
MFEDSSPAEATQQNKADKMIREGATLGMVVNVLRSQGLSDQQCQAVIQKALKKDLKRKRVVALGWILLGLLLIATGVGLAFAMMPKPGEEAGIFGGQFLRNPLALSVFGLIILIYGLVSIFQSN